MPTIDFELDALGPRRAPRQRAYVPAYRQDEIDRATGLGESLSARLRERQAQVRRSFVQRGGPSDAPPTSIRLLRTSPLYLKLYLTLLWASAGNGASKFTKGTPRELDAWSRRSKRSEIEITDAAAGLARLVPVDPHTTQFPLVDLAQLLGLRKPSFAGTQSVSRGLVHLAAQGLIWIDRGPGVVPHVQIRREDGSGVPYFLPGEPQAVKGGRPKAEGDYFSLPPELWSRGWMGALSGRAVATLLALVVQQDFQPDVKDFWIAPSIREDRFDLKSDTFFKGAAELAHLGLVEMRAQDVRAEWSRARKTRHIFTITFDRGLQRGPVWHL